MEPFAGLDVSVNETSAALWMKGQDRSGSEGASLSAHRVFSFDDA